MNEPKKQQTEETKNGHTAQTVRDPDTGKLVSGPEDFLKEQKKEKKDNVNK